MISVVIPVVNNHDLNNECIEQLTSLAYEQPEIIIVDNASDPPYEHKAAQTIYNAQGNTFWPSMLQGIAQAKNNIVMCMHNDVLIWDEGYDKRIADEFHNDPLLGIAGLFGARGVALNGGRLHPESNMHNLRYGTPGHMHGHLLTGTHPAVVFDSLCMIIDKEKLYTLDYKNIPPHHWTDRILTLSMIIRGYRARTIGIKFDHGGGFTSVRAGTMNNPMEAWCKERNIPMMETWDSSVYQYGLVKFQKLFRAHVPGNELWVTEDYQYKGI